MDQLDMHVHTWKTDTPLAHDHRHAHVTRRSVNAVKTAQSAVLVCAVVVLASACPSLLTMGA